MSRAAAAGKTALAGALHRCGLLRLYQQRALRGRAVVLMYHRVVTPAERPGVFSHESILVDTETFELHLRILSKRFRVIAADEFLEHFNGRQPFPDNSCLITFDDGWRDNYLNAFPLLRRYRLPAAIFVATGFIGTDKRFWQERLAAALLALAAAGAAGKSPQVRAVLVRHGLDRAELDGPGGRKAAVDRVVTRRKGLTVEANEELVADLDGCGFPISGSRDRAFMNWDEVREMHAAGVAFGAHGVGHRLLTALTPDEVHWEVRSSRETLAAQLGAVPRIFSYPNGYHSAAIGDAVRGLGFEAAFATRKGFLSESSARFALGRVNITSSVTTTAPLFLARVLGVF